MIQVNCQNQDDERDSPVKNFQLSETPFMPIIMSCDKINSQSQVKSGDNLDSSPTKLKSDKTLDDPQTASELQERGVRPVRRAASKKLSIQEALEKVGNAHRYQKIVYIFFCLQWLLAGAILMSPIFVFLKPTFECPNGLSGMECEEWVCEQEDPLSYATSIPNSLVMEYDPPLICDRQSIADTIVALNYGGSIIGFLISTYISDNKGRKIASLVFWVLAGVGSIWSGAFSFSMWLVAAGLSIANLGANPTITIQFCFINEHSDLDLKFASFTIQFNLAIEFNQIAQKINQYGKFREYSSALIGVFFGVGTLYLVLTQYITDNWTHLMMYFIGIPTLLSNLFYCFIYEPPIFLYQKDKKKALITLNKIATVNRRPTILENELEDIQKQEQQQSDKEQTFGLFDLFKYRSTRVITISGSIVLFCIQLAYYGTNLTLSNIGVDVRINTIIISLAEITAYLLITYLIPKINRKKWSIGIQAFYSVVFILFFFLKEPSDCGDSCPMKVGQSVIMGVARFILSISMTLALIYFSELYPVTVRAIGMGFVSLVGVVGSAICGYFVTIFSSINFHPVGAMGIIGIISVVAYLPLDETFNKPLKNNITEIENKIIPSETLKSLNNL